MIQQLGRFIGGESNQGQGSHGHARGVEKIEARLVHGRVGTPSTRCPTITTTLYSGIVSWVLRSFIRATAGAKTRSEVNCQGGERQFGSLIGIVGSIGLPVVSLVSMWPCSLASMNYFSSPAFCHVVIFHHVTHKNAIIWVAVTPSIRLCGWVLLP